MLDVCCPRYLPCNSSRAAGPLPPRASPEIYILLVAAPVALIFWLGRNLNRPLLPDQIPAIPEDLGALAVGATTTPPQAEAPYPSDGKGGEKEDEDEASPSGAELTPAFIKAAVDRSAYVDGILDAFRGIPLDINSSYKSNIHPANEVLIQSISVTGDYTIEPYSVMFHGWVAKVEEDAESICKGEKGRRYIFLLNNTYDVWQKMRNRGVPVPSRLTPMIQIYMTRYLDECWVPLLNSPWRLDRFTSDFVSICNCQMEWKVTAELKYKLRQEIVDLIIPSYTSLALKASRSRLPKVCYCIKRVMTGRNKQKKHTVQELEDFIRELFEGGKLADGLMGEDENTGLV